MRYFKDGIRLKPISAPSGVDGNIYNDSSNNIPKVYRSGSYDAFVLATATQTLSGKTLTAPVIATIVNSGTLTLPTSTDTLVGRVTTDTLANKTLTAPIIATIVNSGTLTLPTSTDTLVGRATTDTLTNKSMSGSSNTFTNLPTSALTGIVPVANGGLGTDASAFMGLLKFASGVASVVTTPSGAVVGTTDSQTLTNKTLTSPVISTISNTGTLTLPTSTDTLVGRATTDTLTNKTLTAPVIAIIVNSGTLTLPTSTDTLVGKATTDTLTNKTLTSPVIATIVNSGTLTLPTSTDTLVGRATTDTLTNKTLTAPVISTISNSGTVTLPTGTRTLVARDTTDTLTNKTLTGPNIDQILLAEATAPSTPAAGKLAVYAKTDHNLYIKDSTGTETAVATNAAAAAKAWVIFDGNTGTIASSFNVTSVTRNTTGNYTVNFTSALNNVNYSYVITATNTSAAGPVGLRQQVSKTTSALRFVITNMTPSSTDVDVVCVHIFGT